MGRPHVVCGSDKASNSGLKLLILGGLPLNLVNFGGLGGLVCKIITTFAV